MKGTPGEHFSGTSTTTDVRLPPITSDPVLSPCTQSILVDSRSIKSNHDDAAHERGETILGALPSDCLNNSLVPTTNATLSPSLCFY